LPTFAHLIDAPSPHSSAVSPGGSVGGLRRWASCGIEWPTSKTKRRKTAGAFRRDPDDECAELTEEPAAADGATKLSRVGLLIERIQETLVKPAASDVTMAPSSSSLLSETFAHHPAPPDSPLQKLVGVAGEVNEDSGTDDLQQSPIEPRIMDHEKSQQPMSSDFGGEDIDLETIQEIEQTNGVTRPEYQSRPTSACALNAEETQYHDASDVLAPEETIKEPLVVQEDDSDEFGGDDDLDVTDLENVVSLYDKRPDLSPTRSATAGSQEPQRGSPIEASSHPGQDCHVESGGSSDDEFGGDDIDDEQFAAAELAATQSYRASAASEQPHVRT
ncbi:DNA replication endonuclease-helicase Dna2, partial [Cryomyces antarcticus]